MIKTQVVKLKVNKTMRKHLDALCDYRRYCWNKGLETWQLMYEAHTLNKKDNPSPNERRVRDELVANKADWQYALSARCLQLAVKDLANAWKNFFDKAQPDWGIPSFKSKKDPRQGFKTDRAKIVNGKLRLDKPRSVSKENWFDLKSYEALKMDEVKVVSIFKEKGSYYAALPYEEEISAKAKTQQKTAVDVNVGHFNYTEGQINVLPAKLQKLYKRIKHYQRTLAVKRKVNGKLAIKSNNYYAVRTKLQRDYRKVANIQNDLLQKFTTQLVNDYDQIVIEDLAVKEMMMTHVASKGMQRSVFSKFRQILTYKCAWYGKELILADKTYPSTQRCAECGYVKKGDEKITLQGNQKHGTKHNEYICYQCGYTNDRDENAVLNLLALAK
ncbi:RNA-guided endonuclease InsQ/TnpB family protein [Lactobacillus pasteurii]|uniref:Transposase n=1 Tax=Lactobacillus pasteurii DSM 23907 = CRBIP 24.76 TaxID=1423790 RepID=I7JXN6_9LACO|nr:RNA-guided endonuclease TnpB family protein [Lactobacillus pasteurii]CCI84412.1 Transposase [Lactobacillus pasteurii DSM 23907 = CRBIP 24.76]CCI84815.1 Transposase [Lactobacillus pasteurii DSM 23907 = CRBIP 24.76]CCI85034.1 Transposase [Lactobacillus pasteurii DSM 23907 = CRBIP 24.76]CCI85087.1 Transposase [Lactobacillus pasteurii DSM 23907 = CRBIP 24.76]